MTIAPVKNAVGRAGAGNPLLAALSEGVDIFDLGRALEAGMPCSPNHPGFRMALQRRHGDVVRSDGGSAANELIVTGGHVGTHVDALAHVSHCGELYGGVSAHEAQTGGKFSAHGAEHIEPMVCRGVLFDVAARHKTPILPAAHPITAGELAEIAEDVGIRLGAGDVVLVNTGWGRLWDADPTAYLGVESGVPGITEDAAAWLAGQKVRAVGVDTTAAEHIPAGKGHAVMPAHRVLLVESGVHIIEHLDLRALAGSGFHEFVFVLSPLKIVGGTGSPVRPLAVVPGSRDA